MAISLDERTAASVPNAASGAKTMFHDIADGLWKLKDDVGAVGSLGADATAIHTDGAAEISALTNKAVPLAADHFVLESAGDANAKRRSTFAQIEATLSHDALTDFLAAEHVDWAGASAGTIHITNIANGDVTYAKIQNVSVTDTFLGRDTVGAGPIEEISASAARAILNVADGANNYSHPNHTGDVTSTGDGATVIAANAVTLAMQADIATASIVGRLTAATGDPEVLTGTQATTLLDVFASGLKGLAPASGGGTTNFLRADGTWTAPAGGGSHDLLSATHTDTTAAAVTRGGLVVGKNVSPKWELLTIGTGVLHADGTDISAGALLLQLTSRVTTLANALLAQMAANTVKANATAGLANAADLAVGTNTVVGRVAGNIVAAQLATAQVANDAVTYAKMQNVSATARLLGRFTAGAGDTEELTGTQATTLLDVATAGLQGLAPASGGGTTNFLRADLTWAAPAGGGSHELLSATHTDTLTATVVRGDLVVGNLTPKWARLALGGAGTVLHGGALDPSYSAVVTADITAANITNALLATMAANTVKTNATAGVASPADLAVGASTVVGRAAAGNIVALTTTQLTALVNDHTDALSGGVPASGGGTTNFLRADQTWAAPPGGGSHELLSATHTDTLTATVVRGDIIVGNVTPAWSRLALGGANTVLHGGALDPSYSAVVTADITANNVTNALLAQMAANTVKANATAGLANAADLAVGTNTVLGRVAGNLVAAQVVGAQIATATVTDDKLENMAAWTIKLNNTAGSAAPADVKISALTDEASPSSGMFGMLELATGELRRFDFTNLPAGAETNNLAVDGIAGIVDNQLAVGTGAGTAGYQTLPTGAVSFNGTVFAQAAAADLTDGVPSARTITVAGTASEVVSSAGALDLSANRTWTLGIADNPTFPGDYVTIPTKIDPDPTGSNGRFFFNSTDDQLRYASATVWRDLLYSGGALGTPSSGNLGSCTAYPGDSSLVTVGTIASGTWNGDDIANANLAQMAANTIQANPTAGLADATAMAVGTNVVVGRVAGNIVAAQLVDAQIATGTVTLAKQADVLTASIMGRVTAATGVQERLSGTQATTLLDVATAGLKGLAPASGGGTTNFLRADLTWAAPAGGSGDAVSVNASAATDADFDDVTPAAPAGDLNVKWQIVGASPSDISAYVDVSVLEPLLSTNNLVFDGLTAAADRTIDLTGAASRKLSIINSTASQVCNLQVDGRFIFENGTGQTMVISGTPTVSRIHTIPDVTNDTFTMNLATQTLLAKTLTLPIISTNQALATDGHITIDTTNAQFKYRSNSVNRVLMPFRLCGIPFTGPATADENIMLMTEYAITIEEVKACGRGGTSIAWELRQDTDADNAGTLIEGNTTTTNGLIDSHTVITAAAVPAGRVIWVELDTVTGTVDDFTLQFRYTVDAT